MAFYREDEPSLQELHVIIGKLGLFSRPHR